MAAAVTAWGLLICAFACGFFVGKLHGEKHARSIYIDRRLCEAMILQTGGIIIKPRRQAVEDQPCN